MNHAAVLSCCMEILCNVKDCGSSTIPSVKGVPHHVSCTLKKSPSVDGN